MLSFAQCPVLESAGLEGGAEIKRQTCIAVFAALLTATCALVERLHAGSPAQKHKAAMETSAQRMGDLMSRTNVWRTHCDTWSM
jgi:hypothetical protein